MTLDDDMTLYDLQSDLAKAKTEIDKRHAIRLFAFDATPEAIEALIVMLTRDLFGHDLTP